MNNPARSTTATISKESTSRSVRTADWNIHYQEAGSGHPLILLHGSGPGSSGWNSFNQNIAGLAAHFRVLAPDLPGWGYSGRAPLGKADRVDTVRQFMDALGLERAALAGNSMGGLVALGMAAQHGHRVTHVITMGAPEPLGLNLFGPDGLSEGLQATLQAYREPSPESMRVVAGATTFDPALTTDDMVVERVRATMACEGQVQDFLAGFGQPGFMPFTSHSELAAITCPALIIHGRNDRTIHYEHALRLLALLPDSRLHLINRCGHLPQFEHASEFNALVACFLGGEGLR